MARFTDPGTHKLMADCSIAALVVLDSDSASWGNMTERNKILPQVVLAACQATYCREKGRHSFALNWAITSGRLGGTAHPSPPPTG